MNEYSEDLEMDEIDEVIDTHLQHDLNSNWSANEPETLLLIRCLSTEEEQMDAKVKGERCEVDVDDSIFGFGKDILVA